MSAPAYAVTDAGFRVGEATLLSDVSLEVSHGELLALVGPNGAGKSTLLSLLSGERRPTEGRIEFEGAPLADWSTKELARRRSMLGQDNQVAFPFTVHDVVAMGRAPWRGRAEEEDDDAAVAEALERADVTHLADRTFPSLSGGERARVSLARVLAQRTSVVLLDEPTAALDLRHQEDVMRLARDLAAAGKAVIVVVHDLSLAAAYATRMAVLDKGSLAAVGTPAEVLRRELLERVYGLEVRVIADDDGTLVVPRRHLGARGEAP